MMKGMIGKEKPKNSGFGNKITALTNVLAFSWRYCQKVSPNQITLLWFYSFYTNIEPIIKAYFTKLIIDLIIAGKNFPPSLVFKNAALIVFCEFTFETVSNFVYRHRSVIRESLKRKLLTSIEIDLAYKHSSLPISLIENSEFINEYNLVKKESGFRTYSLLENASEFVGAIFSFVVTLAIILRLGWQYFLILAIFQIPGVILINPITKKSIDISKQGVRFGKMWEIYVAFLEGLRSSYESRILGIKNFVKRKLEKIKEATVGFYEKNRKVMVKWQILSACSNSTGVFAVSFLALTKVIYGKITLGDWQFVTGTALKIVNQIKSIVDSGTLLLEASIYTEKLNHLLSFSPPLETSQKKPFNVKEIFSLEFKNVSFRYPNAVRNCLNDISFTVGRNESIAIVGENGAGKTTLVKLLCRFYQPTGGKILVNGIDIQKFNLESYWKNFSALFQNFETYGVSARESIGYGDVKNIGKLRKIKRAAKSVGINRFLTKLKNGYETPLLREMENGVDLSTGQWQKVALARAIFRSSKIIILDEPTSNLDPKSEEEIFKKLMRVAKKRIMLLISHRFSTVKKADRIIVVEKGRITESGSHKELMRKNGAYAKLFKLQAQSYKE